MFGCMDCCADGAPVSSAVYLSDDCSANADGARSWGTRLSCILSENSEDGAVTQHSSPLSTTPPPLPAVDKLRRSSFKVS